MQAGWLRGVMFSLLTMMLLSRAAILEASVVNKYGRWGFGKPYGYRDKVVASNRWEVKGLGTSAQPGYMSALVLRRAAVLAKANNYDYFYVVGAAFSCSGFGGYGAVEGPHVCDYVLSQSALLIAVGITSPDEQRACEGRDKDACRAYLVQDVIQATNSYFGLTDDQFQQEVAAAKNKQKGR